MDLVELKQDGTMHLHFHAGQAKAWNSTKRFILMLAGSQSGKTSFGPHWLHREVGWRGPGDYMVVTPSYRLLELKALPEFRRIFETILRLGEYKGSPSPQFVFSEEGQRRMFGDRYDPTVQTRVLFGYAAQPESLESATAKAAWLDEAGQNRFLLGSFEAILRRLSLARGRMLISTTPYNLGWIKQQLFDKWKAGDPDIDVFQFRSTLNPSFSQEEFADAQKRLPAWKFKMFYEGLFMQPAGLIYDCFDEDKHRVPRFDIPDHWERYMGVDFGGVNTAAVFYAKQPGTDTYYLYREYKAGSKTAKEHVQDMLYAEPRPKLVVGGSWSEDQWRREFQAAGLNVIAPDQPDVEVGIDRVYGAHRRDEILAFNDLRGYLDEKATYSRELDDQDNPTEKIADKNTFHLMDAERYIMGYLNRHGTGPVQVGTHGLYPSRDRRRIESRYRSR